MKATFQPSRLYGRAVAPPSKSMAHRALIGAALSGEKCTLSGVDFSEDILATIDCLEALGATVTRNQSTVTVEAKDFLQTESPVLDCRESGSTLRFLVPLALCLERPVVFRGAPRLFCRPLSVYESLCAEEGFVFQKEETSLTVCGNFKSRTYRVRGDVSSQFISGLVFALVYRNETAFVEVLPPFESRSYVELTLASLRSFGADVSFAADDRIAVRPAALHGCACAIEGDYSNGAFLDAFNCIGSSVVVENLLPASLQGDRVYRAYFEALCEGMPTLDLSDCPDLGPVLFALAALKNGASFTGTDRLRDKESDRVAAMQTELEKLGAELILGDNCVTVMPRTLVPSKEALFGHGDHRIVMALSVVLSKLGGVLEGAEAVKKSYPSFFADIRALGCEVEVL